MAASLVATLVLCACAAAADPKPFAIPGFPLDYSSALQVALGGTSTVTRTVYVDVEGQRERVDLDANTQAISFYKKNMTYMLSHPVGSRLQCIYYPTFGAVNGSVSFPSILSVAVGALVTIDGVLCQPWTGVACIQLNSVPIDPTQATGKPFCSNFTYYSTFRNNTPVRFEMASPGAPGFVVVSVDYRNVSYDVPDTLFDVPSTMSCSEYQFCNTSCAPPNITTILDIPFCNVALIPSWLLAVIIGLAGAYFIMTKFAKGVVGRIGYSISFGTYAFMITSGFVVHCVFLTECGGSAADESAYTMWMNIDAGLSSCIAMSFFFNGLIDMELLSEKDDSTYLLMAATYLAIFYAYVDTEISMFYLYSVLILIACGSYIVMQVFVLYKHHSFQGFGWAIAAGIAGFVGLYVPEHFYCWFCEYLGGSWLLEPFWYYLSDLSVIFLVFYVAATRVPLPGACSHGTEKCKACLEAKGAALA